MSLVVIKNSVRASQQILDYTQTSAPAIILAVFLVAIVGHGVLAASPGHDVTKSGPGGRPLPERRQQVNDFSPSIKLLFNWLGLFSLMTFAANALLIVLQVIIFHREKWWPGQAAVVSLFAASPNPD